MASELERLLNHPEFKEGEAWTRITCRAGDELLHEGEDSHDVFLVLQGAARASKQITLQDERSIRSGLDDIEAGGVFGEMNLFDLEPRSASVLALSDLEVARIDGNALARFLDANPAVGYPVLKELFMALTRRLRMSDTRAVRLFAWGLKKHGIDSEL